MSPRAKLLLVFAVAISTPAVSMAGWPWSSDGPRRGSEAWYAARACDPVGERQKCKHAKAWPPIARPAGPPQTCAHKYHALHYWPWPHNIQDREDVRYVMQAQVASGWTTATTLYDYHFDPVTHQLNSSGKQQLAWIYQQAPPAYRHIYVMNSQDQAFNEPRMLSVQKSLASIAGSEASMPIAMRTTGPLGRPATEVEYILEQSAASALPPKIEYQSVGTAQGGGN
jgi:hypothetical protein